MKKNVFIFMALLVSLCLFSSGCFYLVVGAVGAVGGYAVSDDAIQGETDKGIDKIWGSALKVTNILGTIETEDRQKGVIEAKVDTSKVKITVDQLTPKTSRMRVSARRHLLPNRKLAQKIYLKIIENAK